MLGAIIGDIVGSIYEIDNIKTKEFELFSKKGYFTDDSVMTCAISKACCEYSKDKNIEHFKDKCIKYMQKLGRAHINAGYGGAFIRWLISPNPKPYNSWGNGSAMRVSPIGWTAESLEEAETLAEVSASVSHNHIFGINGAKAIAGSILLIRKGCSKEEIKEYITSNYYNLDFTIDKIRKEYEFDVSCQGSVPQAIVAFLEGKNFEDSIRNAISIGGDSDTIAAITGSLAEAYYGIPEKIKKQSFKYLDKELKDCVTNFNNIVLEKTKKKS